VAISLKITEMSHFNENHVNELLMCQFRALPGHSKTLVEETILDAGSPYPA
jgi:hypothetical protein